MGWILSYILLFVVFYFFTLNGGLDKLGTALASGLTSLISLLILAIVIMGFKDTYTMNRGESVTITEEINPIKLKLINSEFVYDSKKCAVIIVDSLSKEKISYSKHILPNANKNIIYKFYYPKDTLFAFSNHILYLTEKHYQTYKLCSIH